MRKTPPQFTDRVDITTAWFFKCIDISKKLVVIFFIDVNVDVKLRMV